MAWRSSALAIRASSGVAVGRVRSRRSSPYSATRCSSTSPGTLAPTFRYGRDRSRNSGSRCASSSAISSCARRLGGCGRSSSSGDTDSALASASIRESFGSRRPFSSMDSAEGARPTRAPSSARVRPWARRRWRRRWPNVARSRPPCGNESNSSLRNCCTTSSYVKNIRFSQRIFARPSFRRGQAGACQPRGRHGSEDEVNDRRLEGTAHTAGHNGNNGASPVGLAARLAGEWATNPRWRGTKRTYTAEDVIRLRGSVREEHTLARLGAERLWTLLHTEDYVHSLGAVTGNQAVQQVRAGLPAIYLSGWQVAADANLSGQTYPDQSLYPVNSVPQVVRRINNALLRADQICWAEGTGTMHHWLAPIVADAEAGFGGVLNAFELMKAMIVAGAAGVHWEDQLAS